MAFTNGHVLSAGDTTGDITERAIRRIQFGNAIKAHLEKGQEEYARIFAEEYNRLKAEYLSLLPVDGGVYQNI